MNAKSEGNNIAAFKKELKKLLKDYNANISFNCSDCSDTYGLYDAHIAVDINDKIIIKVSGWGLGASDI